MEKKMEKFVVCVLAIALCAGVAQADIISNLVGHWKMDDGSGAIAFDSAGSHNGTLVTPLDPQFVSGGMFGGAIDFAGRPSGEVDSYVDAGDGGTLDITGDRTLSTWVKIDAWAPGSAGHWTGIVTKGDVAGNYDIIRNGSSNTVGFYVADSAGGFCAGSANVADGEWHLLTGVYDDAGTMSLYVDGSLDASMSVTGGATTTNDQPLLFNGLQDGKTGWDSSRWFDGQMDDVRLYDRALSADDVFELYSIPEPATMVLFGIGSLALRRRRRAQ